MASVDEAGAPRFTREAVDRALAERKLDTLINQAIAQSQRTGDGATIPHWRDRFLLRGLFLDALLVVAPQVSEELLTPEALEGGAAYISRWRNRHGLNATWCSIAARETIERHKRVPDCVGIANPILPSGGGMSRLHKYHGRTPIPAPRPPNDGPLASITLTTPVPFPAGPEDVYLPDLYYRGYATWTDAHGNEWEEWEDEGDDPYAGTSIGEFDPRAETIDAVMDRIMPRLRQRLRMALQRIVVADMEGAGGIPTRELPLREHMEWLVRYQVLRESYRSIAGNRNGGHVKRTIEPIARALFLELREPDRGGRPPKTAT